MQSCLGSSLNKSLFSREKNENEPSNMVDDESVACSPENEFEVVNFSSALLRLSTSSQCSQLNALESTEYTIHRNIERDLRKSKGGKFNVRDSVLTRNPKISNAKRVSSCDPFQPLNIVGEVNKVMTGGMYKVTLPDGDDIFQKAIFEGEMILFKEAELENSSANSSQTILSKKALLDQISDFALEEERQCTEKRFDGTKFCAQI